MEVFKRQYGGSAARKGSALVMVIVLTVLLSLIGTLFIMMARIDEMSTSSIKADAQLKAGVDAVLDRINDVLVADIFSSNSNVWLDGNGANEAWDYPCHTLNPGPDGLQGTWDDLVAHPGIDGILGTVDDGLLFFGRDDDQWLANLQPQLVDVEIDGETDNDQIGFRHITDLYGDLAFLFQKAYETGSFDPDYADQHGDRISFRNLRATIIDPADEIGRGYKADADGDGVADSRWTKIPNLFSENGKPVYTAVRIIDNGAMINVNTAYRDPTNLDVPGDWDGSRLSHVNLEGITDPDPAERFDAVDIQLERYGTVTETIGVSDFYNYINDIEYENRTARRLKYPFIVNTVNPDNPYEFYLPFDISDELELRNRFFLSTSFRSNGVEMRCARAWPSKFNPQADPGKGIPYMSGDDIDHWYAKVGPDGIGSSNRRHYSTTYNFDRIVRPYDHMHTVTTLSDDRKFGVTLPLDIQQGQAIAVVEQNYIKRLAMALYRGLPNDIQTRFGDGVYTREELAWQMAVNMVDYQDDKLDEDEEVTKITIGDKTYFGVEDFDTIAKDTLCISKLGHVNVTDPLLDEQYDDNYPPTPGRYFAVEVFNPDENAGKDLNDYEIKIVNVFDNQTITYTLSGTLSESTVAGNTSVFVFVNSLNQLDPDKVKSALSMLGSVTIGDIKVKPNVSDIDTGYKVIVVKRSTEMPVDSVTIPSGLVAGPDARIKKYRSLAMPGTNLLLPKWSSADDSDIWTDVDVAGAWRLGNDIDATATPPPEGSRMLEDPTDSESSAYDPDLAGLEKVQLDVSNQQLRNLGQIENVFAVGTNYYEITGFINRYKCNTLIGSIVESVMAIKNDGADLTADQQDNIEMGSFGRIRLDDPDYWPLLDSLTYFDPARDGVDLVNIAEPITPVGTVDLAFIPLDTLTDGLFLPRQTSWDSGTVYWTDLNTTIEIDLGATETIFGAIIQADNNDEYVLEYYDGVEWHPTTSEDPPLWSLEDYGSLGSTGMHTRPDMYDDGRWHLFDVPVMASKVRVRAIDGDDKYSVSEIQIGVKYDNNADDPYRYADTVAGRVNVNTAPWYVINQLPWLEDASAAEPASLAQAIVAFRDKGVIIADELDYRGASDGRSSQTNIIGIDEEPGFKNIGQLLQVINTAPTMADYDIRKNIFDDDNALDLDGDYTPDNSIDDFEERNLLFHRISNLVTVRSDVFTAYVLVRIGENGPQRRMIAIFDRSGIDSPSDEPKLVALHRVPDPR